ncbi:hypothetical protein GOODEAATRI_007266 [Goodea atripinnis]|uniref:Uncharacterized protein n=1 Tax=Goodea atripinnis TaxID=208336 RepID=A0ABV0PC43_9TELE
MTAVRNEAAMDVVERRKLHVLVADLRKEAQRLRKLVDLTRPAQMPSLLPGFSSLLQKLPPKRPNLPAELFNMKELPPAGEEEEEEAEEEKEAEEVEMGRHDGDESSAAQSKSDCEESSPPLGHLKESEGLKGKNSRLLLFLGRCRLFPATRWQHYLPAFS